jgi:hypothetical protein
MTPRDTRDTRARPRWFRIARWRLWQVRRALESFCFGAFPGERL